MCVLPFADNPLRTRGDVQRLVRDLAEPLVPHFSPGRAHVRLGENRALYGDPAGWLEGYARPLWGWCRWGRVGESLTIGSCGWMAWLRASILSTRSSGDGPAITISAASSRRRLVSRWRLRRSCFGSRWRWQRARSWLFGCRRINDVQLVRSNWLFFRVLVNLGLKRCGHNSGRQNRSRRISHSSKRFTLAADGILMARRERRGAMGGRAITTCRWRFNFTA